MRCRSNTEGQTFSNLGAAIEKHGQPCISASTLHNLSGWTTERQRGRCSVNKSIKMCVPVPGWSERLEHQGTFATMFNSCVRVPWISIPCRHCWNVFWRTNPEVKQCSNIPHSWILESRVRTFCFLSLQFHILLFSQKRDWELEAKLMFVIDG